MRMLMTAMAAAALLAGGSAAEARPRAVETIRYSVGPCYGTCPVYSITVSSDGRGRFVGERHTAVVGTRAFRVTPQQWAAFRGRLAALHGRGTVDLSRDPPCETFITDQPGVEVQWSGRFRPATVRANYGCRDAARAWQLSHLRQAPGDLPIAGFIGRR